MLNQGENMFKYISLIAFLLIVSCKQEKTNYAIKELKNPINAVIDTLSYMNSLFDIERIYLNVDSAKIKMGNINRFTCDHYENVYLVDNNNEIFIFNREGDFVKKISRIGRGPGEYLGIDGLIFDKHNNIYLDDFRQLCITKYDSDFKYLGKYNKEKMIPAVDMEISKGKLYLFTPFATDNSISIYDLDSFEKINDLGRIDQLQKEYKTRLHSGSLIIHNENIYYSLPNYYQIFNNKDGEEKKLLSESASHFKKVDKVIKNPFKDLNKFSAVFRVFKEDNYFFLVNSPARGTFNRKSNERMPTDIININGDIIREAVFFKDFQKYIVKYDSKKYLTYGYDEKENQLKNYNDDIKPFVMFLKYKY